MKLAIADQLKDGPRDAGELAETDRDERQQRVRSGLVRSCPRAVSFDRKAMGFVTQALKELCEKDKPDLVIAIGPLPMMNACVETTRPFGVKTMVSLNAIMVDGTGMCGSCRVTVNKDVKFACVDGPDFDGHLVDFDDLMSRLRRYTKVEKDAHERWLESCRMTKPPSFDGKAAKKDDVLELPDPSEEALGG